MRGLLALLLMAGMAAAEPAPVWVTAEGHATASGASDAGVRRRALADAMLQATLMAGADVSSRQASSRGVMVLDATRLHVAGTVLQTEILSAATTGTDTTVRIKALVGPPATSGCTRRIEVAPLAPVVDLPPEAPAWLGPFAARLAQDLTRDLADLPGVTLLPEVAGQGPDAYQTLVEGRRPTPGGAHRFGLRLTFRQTGGSPPGLTMRLDMALTGDGDSVRRQVTREIPLPGPALLPGLAALTAPNRATLAARLTAGQPETLAAMVHDLTCAPASARLSLKGDALTIPLGRRHGLAPQDMFVTDDPGFGAEILIIQRLQDGRAILQPLDGGAPARLAGARVRLLGAGE